MMRGWLVVNHYLDSKKFSELYAMLCESATKLNVSLEIKTTGEIICEVSSRFAMYSLPDFVIFWDKDIYVAQRLEKAGIKVFNSSKAIELCDNKILTAINLENKVKTPKTIIAPRTFEGIDYPKLDFLEYARKTLHFPLVIKEAYGSFGKQVYLANDMDEASAIIKSLHHKEFLIQEFIATSQGRDVRVNVVGQKVVSSMLRYNPDDFRSNITNGGKMKPYKLNEQQKNMALKACETLGLDFAGVDLLFGEHDEPLVCEVNSNPHFKSSYICTGIDMSFYVIEYIIEKLKG